MKLPWLQPGEAFPPATAAWGPNQPAPGLLAAGGSLDVDTLVRAYQGGIFPWFSAEQPILWWSTAPRMVLPVGEFALHRSLRKTLRRWLTDSTGEVRFDSAFPEVIRACATSPREGQGGTWIVPEMVNAYINLHLAGYAHSVETWVDGQLVGGLYCVALGRAVFGESMFARRTDASKLALCALVAYCRSQGVELIDCQQDTRHLASLGARAIPREDFLKHVARTSLLPALDWHFKPVYWNSLVPMAADA